MKAMYMIMTGVISLALAALASCSDPVYATVEKATRTATNTLPLLLSITDIAVTATGSTYSVAAGAIFEGSLSGVGGTMTWTPNTTDTSRPFNPPGLQCFGGMALFPYPPVATTRLYGGFIDTSGNPSLYQSDPFYSFGSGSATQLPTVVPGEQVTLFQSTFQATPPTNTLFMGGAVIAYNSTILAQQYVYELDYSTNGTNWTATNLTNLQYPVAGVGYDGANYWTASGSTIYQSSANSFAPYIVVAVPGIGTDMIESLFVDPVNGGRIFVTTKTQGIFYSLTGGVGTWSHIPADSLSGGSSGAASYLCVAGPVDIANQYYLVGSDGLGYYTLDTGSGTWTRFPDSTILLYTSSVRRIVVDSAPGQENVLMGTNRNSLWRGVFDTTAGTVLSGTNQYWIHE